MTPPASAPTPDRASAASGLRADPPPTGSAGLDLSPEAFPESPAPSAAAWHSVAAQTLGRAREWHGKLLPRLRRQRATCRWPSGRSRCPAKTNRFADQVLRRAPAPVTYTRSYLPSRPDWSGGPASPESLRSWSSASQDASAWPIRSPALLLARAASGKYSPA